MHSSFLVAIEIMLLPVITYSKVEIANAPSPTNNKKVIFDSTPRNLRIIAETEEKLYHVIGKYYTEENLHSGFVRYLGDYERSNGLLDDDPSVRINQVVSHPSLILRMLIRITSDLPAILDYFKSENMSCIIPNPITQRFLMFNHFILAQIADEYDELREIVYDVVNEIGWPDEYDLNDAFMGILRIHKVYEMDLRDLVRGMIMNKNTGVTLESRHCFLIGRYAFSENKYFAQAVEWLEMANELVREEKDPEFDEAIILWTLIEAVRVHDEKYPESTNKHFFQPIVQHPNQYKFEGYVSRMKQTTDESFHWKGRRQSRYNDINFRALCSGENLQTDEEKSELYCFQNTYSNPYWTVNPLQTEILSHDPYVAQFYNVLSQSMIDKIINFAEPMLSRSQVYQHSSDGLYSESRTGFTAWLYSSQFPEGERISRRVELLTLLNVVPENSAEELQVAAYTFGGHYDCHLDAIKEPAEYWFKIMGGRIATLMFYLSDVDAGGYTAFPIVGMAATPVQGSAVFWFNYHANGKIDYRTYHGACPVILGESKWVANKWIRSDAQFLIDKCEDADFDEDTSDYGS